MKEKLSITFKKLKGFRLKPIFLSLLMMIFFFQLILTTSYHFLNAASLSQKPFVSIIKDQEGESQIIFMPILTLEQCLEISLANNPLLLSYYDQYQAAQARVNIARSFPQPEILVDYPLQPRFFSPWRSEEKFFWVYQTIEFPGRRYLRTIAASLEANEAFQDIQSLKLSIAYQVKEAFFSLLLIEEKLKYAKENLQLNKDFTDLVEIKYSSGEVSRAEVLRARVELAKAEAMVKQYEIERKIIAARLAVLMGKDKNLDLKIRGQLRQPLLSLNLEEARKEALSLRPEIRKVEYSLHKTETQKKQAYLSYFPDFNLGFAQHQVEGIKYWDFSLSLSVPLFFWQIKRGEVAEAEAQLRSRQKELIYWQNLVSLEVEEAFRQVLSCEEQIKIFEESILDQAEQVYELFLFSFKEGQIGGLDLIEARHTLIDSRLAYAELLYQHALSLAALSRAMGKIQ